jgi:O-antigen/teichoic acid export membrane protein
VGQVLVVATTPIVSRLFSASEIGAFGAFSALESILLVVACLRFDQAVSLARSDDEARPLLRLSILATVATALVVLVGTVLVPPAWLRSIGLTGIPAVGLLLAGTLLFDGLGQALQGWAVQRRDLDSVALSRASLGAAQATGQVGLGAAGTGSGGLAVGYLAGRVVGAAHLWRRSGLLGAPDRAVPRERPDGRDIVPMRRWRYPALLAPAALLNAASLQVPTLLIAARYDTAALGAVVLAMRLVSAPMLLAGQGVGQAFTARLAALADPATRDLRPQLRAAAGRLGLLGAALALPMVLVGPPVAAAVLGSSWRDAGVFTQLLAPAMALQLVVGPLAIVLVAKGRQEVQLGWDSARLAAVVLAIIVPSLLGWGVTGAIAALGVVLFVTYAVLLGLIWCLGGAPRPQPSVPA